MDLLGAGLSILGGIDANNQSSYQARLAADNQRMLRRNSYQDTLYSLQQAELNPMLAFSNGPTATPSVAQAPIKNVTENAGNSSLAFKQAEQLDAQKDLLEAQAAKTRAETPVATNTAAKIEQETFNLKEDISRIRAQIDNINQNTRSQIDSAELNRQQSALTRIEQAIAQQKIGLTEAQEQYQRVLAQLARLEVPGAKNEAEMQEGIIGKILPYGKLAGQVIGGVTNSASKLLKKAPVHNKTIENQNVIIKGK